MDDFITFYLAILFFFLLIRYLPFCEDGGGGGDGVSLYVQVLQPIHLSSKRLGYEERNDGGLVGPPGYVKVQVQKGAGAVNNSFAGGGKGPKPGDGEGRGRAGTEEPIVSLIF